MEQKFGKNSIDIEALREFCEREGKEVTYRKGEQFEREGDPARWFEHKGSGTMCYEASLPIDMGQIFSIPFIILGVYCMLRVSK